MTDNQILCSLCNGPIKGYGNNPEPLAPFGQPCCDDCNATKVIPARLEAITKHRRQR